MSEVLTFILVVITGYYAWTTFRILKANENTVNIMKQQIDSSIRPYITVNTFLSPTLPVIYLKISNTGRTAAFNLRLEIDRPFYQYGHDTEDNNLAIFSAFQNSIDCFSPGASLIFALAQGFVIFGKDAKLDKTPIKFSVKARYAYAEKTVEEVTYIDLHQYLNSQSEPAPILEELKKIVKAIENLSKK